MNNNTPVEIDTELARIYNDRAEQIAKADRSARQIQSYENSTYNHGQYADAIANNRKAIEAAQVEIDRLTIEALPLEAEYAARRWTRYFLVDNTNGHVHSSMNCSTCFRTTQYAWLVQHSGMAADDLVELAGEEACTICFPNAPVATLNRPSLLTTPEREAAAKAREERAAKKAIADAKKAANSITNPDGSTIRFGKWDTVTTVSAAWRDLTDAILTVERMEQMPAETRNNDYLVTVKEKIVVLFAALEAKFGDINEELSKKVNAKAKREGLR